jgi:response regulator RpfG family c-di-GMP phosphodiesterase
MTTGDIIELPGTGQRILLVDDEEVVLAALRETLHREGYEVFAVPDPLDALGILRQTQFAIVVTDQKMPALTGLEFLAQVKDLQPHATRILMTGVMNLETIISSINNGEIYRFIVKPWMREELLVAIKNGVQRYRLICHNAALQAVTLAMNEKLAALNVSLEQQVARETRQNQELAKLNRALAGNLQRSVELCFKTMQTFYPALGAQATRVFGICTAMADDLKLSPDQRQILEISAWLHDIGLVGVPRGLIKLWQGTPASLNDAERALVEQHPVLGQELVGFFDHLQAVGAIIRAHHERFDGQGYPDRLAGDRIPWLARLLAVAASYCESKAREGLTVESIAHASGTVFDPEAVRVLLRCRPAASVRPREREVRLSELRPGMVLSKGVYTATGLLLIPEGQTLSTPYIDKLLNHDRVNPISQSLLVYC